jgi:hypothetical protein
MARTSDACLCGVPLCTSASSMVQPLNFALQKPKSMTQRTRSNTEEGTEGSVPVAPKHMRLDNIRYNEYNRFNR